MLHCLNLQNTKLQNYILCMESSMYIRNTWENTQRKRKTTNTTRKNREDTSGERTNQTIWQSWKEININQAHFNKNDSRKIISTKVNNEESNTINNQLHKQQMMIIKLKNTQHCIITLCVIWNFWTYYTNKIELLSFYNFQCLLFIIVILMHFVYLFVITMFTAILLQFQ